MNFGIISKSGNLCKIIVFRQTPTDPSFSIKVGSGVQASVWVLVIGNSPSDSPWIA